MDNKGGHAKVSLCSKIKDIFISSSCCNKNITIDKHVEKHIECPQHKESKRRRSRSSEKHDKHNKHHKKDKKEFDDIAG
jgi:hypothetical protein